MIRKLPTLSEGGESTPDESQGDVFPSGLNNLVPKFKVGKKVEKKLKKERKKKVMLKKAGSLIMPRYVKAVPPLIGTF